MKSGAVKILLPEAISFIERTYTKACNVLMLMLFNPLRHKMVLHFHFIWPKLIW